MAKGGFENSVFVNCPFDKSYTPLLEAILFCLTYSKLRPRLANESLEAGENRLDKIVGMIRRSKYSVHDLSRCRATTADEYFRMNMPFEFGIDVGLRRSGVGRMRDKKFLIFEGKQYDLKQALSDTAGTDVEYHDGNYEQVMRKVRNFIRVEAAPPVPGAKSLLAAYVTFQGWLLEKKLAEGHSEEEAIELPVREKLDEMEIWHAGGQPSIFDPG